MHRDWFSCFSSIFMQYEILGQFLKYGFNAWRFTTTLQDVNWWYFSFQGLREKTSTRSAFSQGDKRWTSGAWTLEVIFEHLKAFIDSLEYQSAIIFYQKHSIKISSSVFKKSRSSAWSLAKYTWLERAEVNSKLRNFLSYFGYELQRTSYKIDYQPTWY